MLVRTYHVDQESGAETLHWEGPLAECIPDDEERELIERELTADGDAAVGGGAMPLVRIRRVEASKAPSYEQIQARALICALADACYYLNHIIVHDGDCSLDVGELRAALEHGGVMLDMASIDFDDLREWEARVKARDMREEG